MKKLILIKIKLLYSNATPEAAAAAA